MSTSSGWLMAKATARANESAGIATRRRIPARPAATSGSVTLLGELGRDRAGRDDGRADVRRASPPGAALRRGRARRAWSRHRPREPGPTLWPATEETLMTCPDFCRCHVRQRRGDAVEHALDVDVDHPVPFVDLEALERRVRHQPGVVDASHRCGRRSATAASTSASTCSRSVTSVGKRQRLAACRRARAPAPRCDRRGARPAPAARLLRRKQPRRRLAEAAARAGDDDDLVLDALGHGGSLARAGGSRPQCGEARPLKCSSRRRERFRARWSYSRFAPIAAVCSLIANPGYRSASNRPLREVIERLWPRCRAASRSSQTAPLSRIEAEHRLEPALGIGRDPVALRPGRIPARNRCRPIPSGFFMSSAICEDRLAQGDIADQARASRGHRPSPTSIARREHWPGR